MDIDNFNRDRIILARNLALAAKVIAEHTVIARDPTLPLKEGLMQDKTQGPSDDKDKEALWKPVADALKGLKQFLQSTYKDKLEKHFKWGPQHFSIIKGLITNLESMLPADKKSATRHQSGGQEFDLGQ